MGEAASKLMSQYQEEMAKWKQSPAGKSYQKMCEAHAKRTRLAAAKKRIMKDEPKKPQTAFLIFSNKRRPKLLEDDPKMTPPEVTKALAEQWSKLDGEAKQEILDEEN